MIWQPVALPNLAHRAVLAGLIAILAGGCIVEPPGPPTASTSFRQTVHLDAERPTAARHLLFEVSRPARDIHVELMITAHRFLTENTGEFAEDVSVSVRPDDPATTVAVGSPGDARPGAIVSLTELCAQGCKSGVMVLVRGTIDARPTDEIAISTELSASGSTGDQSPLGTTLSLSDDEASAFDGDPTAVTARVAPMVSVSEAFPTAHLDLVLDVDAESLTDQLVYPLVGSITLRVTGDPATHEQLWSHWASPIGRLSVNGEVSSLAPEGAAYDIDWLPLCEAATACEVQIGVDIDYDTLISRARVAAAVANRSAPPPPSEFRLTLDAVARLEAFDRRGMSGAGLELRLSP